MKKITFLLIAFHICVFFSAFAQSTEQREKRLQEIIEEQKEAFEERQQRIIQYSNEHGVPLIETKDGRTRALYDVVNNVPYFIATDNAGAAKTTGADELQEGGGLGLDLDGTDVSIAVWDGGGVRDTHIEFEGRIRNGAGSGQLNFHATHVAGTIAAAGIDDRAKGMAPKAILQTYSFNTDVETVMADLSRPDQTGLILSNHSYGRVSGWNGGQWFGDPDISDIEDYFFGFYSSDSRVWDEIAFNAPFYTIVTSAGNERGDSGDGTHPPDGPYDVIGTRGTAKNVLTIGAVNKVNNYDGPESVTMSSFSSWGPVDDGRIKPDFVAAGVGVFSTFETADDDYGTLQGTSMSAPNTTGTLALLQQLHRNIYGGNYMKSSQLKALIAHTTKEAGIQEGPDYKFGWGLVDGKAAAQFLIDENGRNKLIKRVVLMEGEEYSFNFTPETDTEVRATIAWIDPPGTPPSPSLDPTDIMLVNDLDLRISKDGEENQPYILDPTKEGAGATKGDNFRDNIEQVYFTTTGGEYTLSVNHKGDLDEGSQEFFLIFDYDLGEDQRQFYWVADEGNWSDTTHWSSTSGGESLGELPGSTNRIIFDNNSFSDGNDPLNLVISGDAEVSSIIYLADREANIEIDGNLVIYEDVLIKDNNLTFSGTGTVTFKSSGATETTLALGNSLSNIDVEFDDAGGNWVIQGAFAANDVLISNGSIDFSESEVTINSFATSETGTGDVTMIGTDLTLSGNMTMGNGIGFTIENTVLTIPEGAEVLYNVNGITQNLDVNIDGAVTVQSPATFGQLAISGSLAAEENVTSTAVEILAGGSIFINDQIDLTIAEELTAIGTSESPIAISSEGQASLTVEIREKFCLEHVDVTNVDLEGPASVNVGVDGSVTNSTNWFNSECDAVLFANFGTEYNCAGTFTYFTDASSGSISTYLWDFGDGTTSSKQNPLHTYEEAGLYTVILTIGNGSIERDYSTEVNVEPNQISENTIFTNSTALISTNEAEAYQWVRDEELIEGATERTYVHNSVAGVYNVLTFENSCSRKSVDFQLSVSSADNLLAQTVKLFPNPSDGRFTLRIENGYVGELGVSIADLSGRIVSNENFTKNSFNSDYEISLSQGAYLLLLEIGNQSITKKIFVK